MPGDSVVAALGSASAQGLTKQEAKQRLLRYGPNRLRRTQHRSTWRILWDQFASMIALLLVAAATAAFAYGENVEGFAILAVILLNAGIGFATERRALRSMESLRELGDAKAIVRRDGVAQAVPASVLVPGDIVILDAGDVLCADVRIVTASDLQADESPLTGESLPVSKGTDPVTSETVVAERSSMLFKGTAITRGTGVGIIVATGMATELGLISSLVDEAESNITPLEKRLNRLARRLIVLTLFITALIASVFVASGRDLTLAIELGVALAIATFPEGLPIVATVALARGMWRMARRNALVEQLAAVETLGSTTVILTDKTGTLTENRMTVVELLLANGKVQVGGTGLATAGELQRSGEHIDANGDAELLEALRIAVLCNNANLNISSSAPATATGDPTEVALLVAGAKAGLTRDELLRDSPLVRELAFDSDTKRMATLHEQGGAIVAAVKGAPESVLESCISIRTPDGPRTLREDERTEWRHAADKMAAAGQRVLALATATVADANAFDFEDLVLIGFVAMSDPPKKHVRQAIDDCQAAGIRVVMVTGDHGATGWSIAAAVGLIDPKPGDPVAFVDGRSLPPFAELTEKESHQLLEARVVARANPQQKLELIDLHQQNGEIVAMTGDGVNDAPALKKADIGVAMGKRGTQVAREAADMVLRDDEFGTIVAAISEGRAIFANIRNFVVYLMTCNVSEILTVGMSALLQGPLPLLPLQILYLNLVTDVFPALALGVCEGSPALMARPPRNPSEPILLRRHWWSIFSLGSVIALCVIAAMTLSLQWLNKPVTEATTIAFLTLALAQLWHVFTMRNPDSGWFRNEVTRNRWIWGAIALCIGLLLLAVHWPPLADVLSLAPPGLSGWTLALCASLVPLIVGQLTFLRRSAVALAVS
tara:strand:+ start:2205 stop:4886 length:2682 start_codon:yes stop_codon:yes gene_type:complete